MRLLVIGGTRFVGRHIVEAANAAGHEVTLFNRGSNAGIFPGVELIQGDRDGGLSSLAGRSWDAVVDTPGYIPRVVRQSAEALQDAVGRYVFISTISVYASFGEPGITEDSPLAALHDPDTEAVTGETYGGLKVLCERAVEAVYGDRALVVRPGFVVGPHDPTDRFTYYPVRAARGGEMLAPGSPDAPVQFIDGRDLAAFTVALVERGASGAFNATGPGTPLTWGSFLGTCVRLTGGSATLGWADDGFLATHGVADEEFPLWVPASESGLHQVSVAKATGAGLTFRPLEQTIRDTLDWRAGLDQPLAGPSPAREAALLSALHSGRHSWERPTR